MRLIYLTTMFFLLCFQVKAQNIDFVFNEDLNTLVTRKKGKSPIAFKVVYKQYNDTVKKASSKRISKHYKQALALVKKAEKDSIDEVAKLKTSASLNSELKYDKKNSEIAKIKKNISDFLISKQDYNLKKNLLKDAQKISNKYHLGHLIYADSEINSANKTKFFILSKNKLDLKVHLKKIIWKLNASPTVQKVERPKVINSVEKNTEVNSRLKSAREKLKKTKKYEIIPEKFLVKSYDELKLGNNLFKPGKVIIGRFVNVGSYYVTKQVKGFKERSLVSLVDSNKKQLTKEDFLFENQFIIIKNIDTQSTYMVYPEFVEEYAINKIASKEKYQNKNYFAQKKYTSHSEKVLDSLILDYNKII